jgi:protease I
MAHQLSASAVAVSLAAVLVGVSGCREKSPPEPQTSHATTTIASPAPAITGELQGKTLAILATNGFEEVELVKTQKLLADKGAKTVVVAPKPGVIQGYNHREPGNKVLVDMTLDQADANTFDGIILPGGVANPDELRIDPRAVRFVRSFAESRKTVAAICHAPWLLIEAGLVRDRTMTSWPSLKTDLLNAGATWVDRDVASDRQVITSRKPEDIEAFVKVLSEQLRAPQPPSKHAAN